MSNTLPGSRRIASDGPGRNRGAIKSDHLLIAGLLTIIVGSVIGLIVWMSGSSTEDLSGPVSLKCIKCSHVGSMAASGMPEDAAGQYGPRPLECPECGEAECYFVTRTCGVCGSVYIPKQHLQWQQPVEEEGCPECRAGGRKSNPRPAKRR